MVLKLENVGSSEMLFSRRMEKLIWTEGVKSEAVLQAVERKGKPYIK